MSRNDFLYALRETVSSEFTDIPSDGNSIDYTFSNRFNRKMEKLIRSQKKVYYHFINTVSKRVAIICLIVVSLFATACSVKAIREPIVEFVTEIYESFTKYFFAGETTKSISHEFCITQLPSGFEITSETKNDLNITRYYYNASGDQIEFSQTITDGTEHLTDAEHGNTETVIVNDYEMHIIATEEVTQVIWIQDKYLMELTYFGEIDKNSIIDIVSSIK